VERGLRTGNGLVGKHVGAREKSENRGKKREENNTEKVKIFKKGTCSKGGKRRRDEGK